MGIRKASDYLSDPAELAGQLIRHGRAVGFILIEELMPEGGRFPIESDRIMGGFQLVDGFDQHHGKAVNCPHGLTGLGDGQGRQGMKGAVHQGVAIHQQQKGFFTYPDRIVNKARNLPLERSKKLVCPKNGMLDVAGKGYIRGLPQTQSGR